MDAFDSVASDPVCADARSLEHRKVDGANTRTIGTNIQSKP